MSKYLTIKMFGCVFFLMSILSITSCSRFNLVDKVNHFQTSYNYPLSMKGLSPEQLDEMRISDLHWGGPGTSTFILNSVFQAEQKIISRLGDIREKLKKATDIIDRYIDSWHHTTPEGTLLDVNIPMDAYGLTQHVTLSWPGMVDGINLIQEAHDDTEWIKTIHEQRGNVTKEDLSDVALGIGRLHDLYGFNLTTKTTRGDKRSHHILASTYSPSVWDLYYIGKECLNGNILSSSVDFLQLALDRSGHHGADWYHPFLKDKQEKDVKTLEQKYQNVVKLHDQVLERKGDRTKRHSTHPYPINPILKKKKKYKSIEKVSPETNSKKGNQNESIRKFHNLCKGKNMQTEESKSKLYCGYMTNNSPYYLIGPLKIEVASLDPYIITVEDIIHQRETETLVKFSSNYLHSSSTKRGNGNSTQDNLRKSSTAWLFNHDSSLLHMLDTRISEITGLNTEWGVGGETYQVVNYGVGGYYTIHHDLLPVNLPYMRFATFLIYLTDVDEGGSTVFPWLGVKVEARKGRGLLWFNSYKSGYRDWRLEHGACPVFRGDKWIINKWIYYGAQMNNYPCDKTIEDVIDTPKMII